MSSKVNDIVYNDVIEMENSDINFENKKSQIYNKYIKRSIDFLISGISLIILSPLFLIIAIIIKSESKGPVFFIHKRVGKNGKVFGVYKFRTMVPNAEELIKQFTPEQMKEFRENFKLENDPRITKIGKFLRKTSLDELPQIINILKGEMSFIGPRPVIKDELENYGENKAKFLSVTPGLTGYWAANGRSNTSYEERMKLELYYIDNISFKMDVKVFIKTIFIVLKREGAK